MSERFAAAAEGTAKRDAKIDTRFSRLEDIIEKGFAAVAEDIGDLRTELHEFRDDTRSEFRDMRSELKSIRAELDELKAKVANITGFRKEIDHAFERLAAIEKHLGITHKIAA